MEKLFSLIGRLEHFVMAVLASFSLLLAVTEVLLRYYFPQMLPDWTAEVVVYLITAAVMVSGGALVSEGRHVNADLFLRMVPENGQRMLEIAFCLAGLVICGVFFERGLGIVEFAMRLDEHSNSSLQFPMYIYYSFVPFAFGLMFIHYTRRLYRYVFKFDPASMTTKEVDLENAD